MKINNVVRFTISLVLWAIGISGFIFFGLLKSVPEKKSENTLAPLVETEVISTRAEGFSINVDGAVQPVREVTYSAEVSGTVTFKAAEAQTGNFITKDTVLVELDRRDYDLEIRRQQEVVNQTNVNIEEVDLDKTNTLALVKLANDDLELAESRVKRFANLSQRNAASEAELEAAKQAKNQALNALQTHNNKISLLQTRRNRLLREKESAITMLKKAELDLSRTTIKASMDGVITQENIEQGDFVQRGTILLRMEDTEKVEVSFSLRMEQLRWIWSDAIADRSAKRSSDFSLPPLDVKIKLDLDGQQFEWPARLARYDGAGINPTTRMVPCIAIVDDPSAARIVDGASDSLNGPPSLMRGMFVSIEIPISSKLPLIEVPTEALRPGNRIWVADRNKLSVRNAKIASSSKGKVVLIADDSDVDIGDLVITSPLPLAVDGMEISQRENNSSLTSTPEKEKDVR